MPESGRSSAVKQICFTLWIGLFAAGLLLCTRTVAAAVTESLTFCMQVLLPALFPFFVLSGWLAGSGSCDLLCRPCGRVMERLFGLSGSCAPVLLLGLAGGYPVGANAAVELYRNGRCSREEALSLLRFCNNAGPAFLIGALGGGMLHSNRLGGLLYLAQVLSALSIGVLFRRNTSGVKRFASCTKAQASLSLSGLLQTVRRAFDTFQNVCAFVLFFAVVRSLLAVLPGVDRSSLPFALFSGLLELTGGLSALTALPLEKTLLLPCCAFLAAFGGLSVSLQTISLLLDAKLPYQGYLWAKLLQGLLAGGFTFLLVQL